MRFQSTFVGMSVVLFANPLFAGTIGVPIDQSTIQSAITAATNGDTILVAPGTYSEAVDFLGKSLTLQSTGGSTVTTINAASFNTSAVKISDTFGAGPVNLIGFTITGGKGTLVGSNPNTSRRGGGVYITGGTVLLRDCKVSNNN